MATGLLLVMGSACSSVFASYGINSSQGELSAKSDSDLSEARDAWKTKNDIVNTM